MAIDNLGQAMEEATVLYEVGMRMAETDAYQGILRARYRRLHWMYAPRNDDQWPEDAAQRPGKIHYTSNIIKPAVDIAARLEAKLPRITLPAINLTDEERARAEMAEKAQMAYLEATGWESWMNRLTRIKHLYGKAILRPYWNTKEKRPDVTLIENPANVRIGWGASDFSTKDWALYEYSVSPFEAMRRWPNIQIIPTKGKDTPLTATVFGGDHADPLGQKTDFTRVGPTYLPSDYERKQVSIWDYWYKRDGQVYNCLILQGTTFALKPTLHKELADIPYIVIQNDYEPGSPEGLSTAGPLIDTQIEMNRALTHSMQLVQDEIDPSWQLVGENNDTLPPGMVPKAGEIVAPGNGNRIEPIAKGINNFPAQALVDQLWKQYHKTSGLGEIAFGVPSSSQESGQALAVQVDAYANRGDPRRALLYDGLKDLLNFWTVMIERLHPKIDLPDGSKADLANVFKDYRRWKIVGPEITPKDVQTHTQNELNKMSAGAQSIRTTMDALGIDSPEDELSMIVTENSNVALNPGKVQGQTAVYAAMQQMQIQQANLAQQANLPGSASALAMAQDRTGQNRDLAQQQQAQPTLGVDQNQPQQATGPGSPPPPGAPAPAAPGINPAAVNQLTLVRANNAGAPQTLNQISIKRDITGAPVPAGK